MTKESPEQSGKYPSAAQMATNSNKFVAPGRGLASAPAFVLVIALLLTIVATSYVYTTSQQRERIRFAADVKQTRDTLVARFDTYTSLLRGATGLFAADNDVTRADFHAYIDRLDLGLHYPGLRSIAFARLVHPVDAARVIASERSHGSPDFHFWPTKPADQDVVAITYIESQASASKQALGFNIASDPVRKVALEAARDQGAPVATGKVLLLQDVKHVRHSGFVLYMPVYTGGVTPPTVTERQKALFGYVYSGFRSEELLDRVLGSYDTAKQLNIKAYDSGTAGGVKDLLFQSEDAPRHRLLHSADLVSTVRITVGGKPWTLVFTPAGKFEEGEVDLTWWALAIGLLISGVLFSIALALARARDASEETAAQLRQSEDALREHEMRQRSFFRDVLAGVTEGKLRLCDSPDDLPPILSVTCQVVLREQSLKKLRSETRLATATANFPSERTHDLITAVGEASMNAVMHAGGGVGIVSIGQHGVVQVRISDNGAGIDVQRLPRATLERGYTTAGSLGHGFFLMLNSVDRLWLLTGPDGTTVVLEQDVRVSEPIWLTERQSTMTAEQR